MTVSSTNFSEIPQLLFEISAFQSVEVYLHLLFQRQQHIKLLPFIGRILVTFFIPSTTAAKMQNIFDSGKVPYEAAKPIKKFTILEYIQFFAGISFDLFRVMVFSVPNYLLSILHCFVYPSRKSVIGQTALVCEIFI